ncbi:MAG: FecR domain-containing protein, partial [Proteobacteria bacterium]|nr:FecR domain-containing protein [Pseudomonadota bacterium]
MAIDTGTAFTKTTPETTETTLIQATPGEITLPEGFSLTTADYARVGADLVLTAPDGSQIVIRDFFALGELPELVSAEGAHIPGDLAAKLAGPLAPGQVAQAGPLTQAEPIGQVENVDGEVIAIRPDGTRVELEVGDPVYQGDVLESGEDGAIGIVLADETSFSMAENGRMVLDEMVYDPGTQEGTIAISIVQGVFTFISGEVAKADPDAMTVITPVATIGIRGTQIGIAYHEGEELQLVLMEEADGFVGEVVVSNAAGVQILNQANQGVTVASADTAPSQPETVSPEAIAETYGAALLSMPESSNVNTYGAEEASADENLEDFDTAAGDEGDAGDDFDLPDFGDDDDGDGPDLGGDLDLGGGGDDDDGGGGGDDGGGGDEPPVDPLPVDPTPPPVEGPRLFGMDQIPFVIPDGPNTSNLDYVNFSDPDGTNTAYDFTGWQTTGEAEVVTDFTSGGFFSEGSFSEGTFIEEKTFEPTEGDHMAVLFSEGNEYS